MRVLIVLVFYLGFQFQFQDILCVFFPPSININIPPLRLPELRIDKDGLTLFHSDASKRRDGSDNLDGDGIKLGLDLLQSPLNLPHIPDLNFDLDDLNLSDLVSSTQGWGIFNLGAEVHKIIFTLSNAANGYEDYVLNPEDSRSFLESTWDKTQKTIVVVHGYTEDGKGGLFSTTKKIITAYADSKRPENLVFVDWHALGRQINYFSSARNIVKVGLRVTEFLVYLKGAGYISNLKDVRLVGFSLGAHVTGVVGHYVTEILEEKVSRITGLDPAGPGFAKQPEKFRLGKEDATFVDVVHTNMGELITTFGTTRVSGHVDFYPNGGEHQPGCFTPVVPELIGLCSHLRAVEYFANSIAGTVYKGCKCVDYTKFKNGSCKCTDSSSMGEFTDQSVLGKQFLTIPLGH